MSYNSYTNQYYSQLSNNLDSDNTNISNISHEQVIQEFDKMNIKEIEPVTQNINKNIFEEDLSTIIDESFNIYLKELNEGKAENVRKQHVLDYINIYKIHLQEIYHWLLKNQTNSNCIYLLGYFKYHGLETNINKLEAFKLYLKAAELENYVAQFDLASIYEKGKVVEKNYEKAFELTKKVAEKEYSAGMNRLGYYYNLGIGTDINLQKAFELYEKAANLGNSAAQYNLALMYKDGKCVENDNSKVFELSKKSAEGKHSSGINLLGWCYDIGIGTEIDMQKAFELYQKSAKLGNDVAQFNLGNMYEYGEGIEKNMNQSIYWYKKSAEQENQKAKKKLK